MNDTGRRRDNFLKPARVQEALLAWPGKKRAAIILTMCESVSRAEATRVLSCSETTVLWRIFAARKKLKRCREVYD